MNNITRSGFDESHEKGLQAERIVLEIIRRTYPKAFMISGNVPGSDIFVPETKKLVEVKHDLKSLETGNYFIEFEMFTKRSGLMLTYADYWVIFDGQSVVWIKPDEIKNIIIWHGLKARRFDVDGVTDSARAFLIPREMIQDVGMVYKIEEI